MSMDELDARLIKRHEELLSQFAVSNGHGPRQRREALLRPGTRVIALAAAAVLTIAAPLFAWRLLSTSSTQEATVHDTTIKLAGLTLTVSAPPPAHRHLTAQRAIDIVQDDVNHLPAFVPHCPPSQVAVGCADKPFTNVRAVSATFVGNVERITDSCGGVFQFGRASAWLVPLSVPPQDGFTTIQGAYVVNDVTATIIGAYFDEGQGNAVVC